VLHGAGTAAGSPVGAAGDLGRDAALAGPGHVFYDRLQAELVAAGFDGFVEGQCAPYYAAHRGRPSLPPGRYFRMLLVGYFEGIDSERGLEWRCADSLSLREFLRLGEREPVPDHSWLSRTRARLPLEVHDAVFTWVLQRLAERGLIRGERIGVDASTLEANAALRTIVRRDTGEGYREMLTRMAQESGIETPTDGRGPGPPGPRPQRQDAVQRGVGEPDRSGGADCEDEGQPDAFGLQARACGRSRHRRSDRGRDARRRPG
jgi:transposase